MIYYVSASGQVVGTTSGYNLVGITYLPIGADYAVLVDDATVASLNPNSDPGTYSVTNLQAGDVFRVPTATGTITFTAQSLSDAKNARMDYLARAFEMAIVKGFPSSADGTAQTYAIDPVSMGKWTGTLANVNSGALTANIIVKDITGAKVTLTPTQFKQFALDGFTYFNNQEQNLWTKEDTVTSATTVDAVNAVVY